MHGTDEVAFGFGNWKKEPETMEDILNMLIDDATECERHFYDIHDDGLCGLSVVDAPLDLTVDIADDFAADDSTFDHTISERPSRFEIACRSMGL